MHGPDRRPGSAARKLGISRAHVTQILDLALLAPSIQEADLSTETADGREPVTEQALREVLKYDASALQEAVWKVPCRDV